MWILDIWGPPYSRSGLPDSDIYLPCRLYPPVRTCGHEELVLIAAPPFLGLSCHKLQLLVQLLNVNKPVKHTGWCHLPGIVITIVDQWSHQGCPPACLQIETSQRAAGICHLVAAVIMYYLQELEGWEGKLAKCCHLFCLFSKLWKALVLVGRMVDLNLKLIPKSEEAVCFCFIFWLNLIDIFFSTKVTM